MLGDKARAGSSFGWIKPRSSYVLLVLVTVPVACLGYGSAFALLHLGRQEVQHYPFNVTHLMFLGAFAFWVVAYILFLRRSPSFTFWQTADHEVTHVIAAILSLRRIHSVSWSDAGRGAVMVDRRTFLIDQAPYVVTIPMVVALILIMMMSPGPAWWLALILGAVLGYHLFSVIRAGISDKADIRRGYYPFHLVWSAVALAICSGLVASAAGHGVDGMRTFLVDTWSPVLRLIQLL